MKSFYSNILLLVLTTAMNINVKSQDLRLSSNVCGQTIQSIGSNIFTNVNRGLGHRYEVSRLDGTIIGVYDAIAASSQFPSRSRFLFRFSFLTGFPWSFNASYRVRVSSFNGEEWSEYGEYCQVNTPSDVISLSSSVCGTQLTSMGVNVLTNSNHLAGHRYEVRELNGDLVGVYDGVAASQLFPNRSPYIFRFSWMPSELIAEGRTYSIRVAAYDGVSGLWGNYGPACNVKTPGLEPSVLTSDYCGNYLIDSLDTRIEAETVAGASSYLFGVYVNDWLVGSIVSENAIIDLKDLSGGHPFAGQVYKVAVATRRNNTFGFGDYGVPCEVAVMGYTTKMRDEYCGKVYNYLLEDSLFAETIPEAEAYRFALKNGDFVSYDTLSTPSVDGYINLSKFPNIQYCVDYELSVSVKVNGIWGPYGESCVVTTVCHPVTQLRPSFCNDTITSCMTNLFSRTILLSDGVQFFVHGPGFSEVVDASAHNRFRFTDLANLSKVKYETSYSVQCRILMNGVWGQWGEPCSVYLKTDSKIRDLCEGTVASMSTNVFASPVGCAQDYRFLINGPIVNDVIINMPSLTNAFRFNQVPGAQMGATYSIQVSVLVNGQWSPFGEACNVSTPMPTKNISFDEDSNLDLVVYPNPSNNQFNVNLTEDLISGYYEIYSLNGALVDKSNIVGTSFTFGENLREGIYLIHVYSNGMIISKDRVVKLN